MNQPHFSQPPKKFEKRKESQTNLSDKKNLTQQEFKH